MEHNATGQTLQGPTNKSSELQSQIKATCTLLATLDCVAEPSLAKQLAEHISKCLGELEALTATQPQHEEPETQAQGDVAAASTKGVKRTRDEEEDANECVSQVACESCTFACVYFN